MVDGKQRMNRGPDNNPLYPVRWCGYCIVVCVAVLISSCTENTSDAILLEAYKRCEALEYDSALPLIRQGLMRRPRDPVGHYLLGKYYQHRENPALTLAKGQFDMARYLFDADGDISILAGIMTPSEFQATLHCDTALVLLRTVIQAQEDGLPTAVSIPVLRVASEHARKARYFNADSPFILDLANTLEQMLEDVTGQTQRDERPTLPPSSGRWEI